MKSSKEGPTVAIEHHGMKRYVGLGVVIANGPIQIGVTARAGVRERALLRRVARDGAAAPADAIAALSAPNAPRVDALSQENPSWIWTT